MRGLLSLQQRVVILMVAAILPIAALSVWIALRESRSVTALAMTQLKFAASLIAANQDRTIESTHALLTAIAAMPDLRGLPVARCNAYFADLKSRNPMYYNVGLLGVDGRPVCHANAATAPAFDAADRPYFQQALNDKRFSMGKLITGRATGLSTIPFGLPVQEGGEVVGVVFATLNLEHASRDLAALQLPAGARVIVMDPDGTVVMEHPLRPGVRLPRELQNPVLRQEARTLSNAAGQTRNPQGDMRLYAFAPSKRVGTEGLMALASLDSGAVAAGTGNKLRDQLIVLALTLATGMLAAWIFAARAIVRPARAIVSAVRELERGKLDARVPLSGRHQRDEFSRIGAAFNLMGDSLQVRQAHLESELRRSQGAYEVLDQVLNNMQEALVAMSAAGEFFMYNDAARKLFPLDEPVVDEATRPRDWGLYHRDMQTLYAASELPSARALRGERGRQMPLFVRNARIPEGRMLLCSWQPMAGPAGITGSIMVFTDVTELERLQTGQIEQLEQLRTSGQALQARERELRGYTGQLQRAAAAAQAITSQPDLPTMLQEVADQGRLVIGAHMAVVSLTRDNDWGQVVTALSLSNSHAKWRVQQTQPDGAGVYAVVCETGRALRLTQAQLLAHPRFRGFGAHASTHLPLRGLLAVPLTGRDGSNMGLLQLSDRLEGDFTQQDEYVALEIAQLASIAIENARLFAQINLLNAGLEARIVDRTAELARQERLYRTLAEQAPEIVWNTDAKGAATFLNRAWYELVGGTPQESLGDGWFGRIHPDDQADVRRNWLRSRQTLEPFNGTRRIRARDGTYHTTSYKATPVLDDDGAVQFWVGIDADITELKSIENALRSSNQELEAFSYSVSHDLRAPLGAIGGFSKALSLKLDAQADDRVRHYLARIHAGVEKMEQLIDALLLLAKVARAPISYGAVDLGEMAREAIEELQVQAPQRSVEVEIAAGLTAQGDARLLRRVMDNLLGNAWKFTAHAPHPRIEVGRLAGDGAFFVRDNGVGFDMAYAGKLFGAFQRLHTEAEFPGTGIGLATVRRIVTRHQGRVWAESLPGEGTVFYFTLGDIAPPAWLAE